MTQNIYYHCYSLTFEKLTLEAIKGNNEKPNCNSLSLNLQLAQLMGSNSLSINFLS